MADDLQSITAEFLLRPLDSGGVSPQNQLASSRPFAQLVHTGSVALTGSGVGDTANIRLTLPLPQNYAYRLERFLAVVQATAFFSWGNENQALIVYAATSPEIASGATTELILKLNHGSFLSRGGTAEGTAFNYMPDAVDGSASCPILYGYADAAVYPVFMINDGETDVDASVLTYWASWLVYELEQTNQANFHQAMPITPSG